MKEYQFIDTIDAGFPYNDKVESSKLIEQGCSISSNAAFMILYEIVCAPKEISEDRRIELLSEWNSKFDHPIKSKIVELSRQFIKSETPSRDECYNMIKEIKEFRDQYNALNTVMAILDIGADDKAYKDTLNAWKEST